MKNSILIDYDLFISDLALAQAIKVASNTFLSSLDYNIFGKEEHASTFKGYSKNINLLSLNNSSNNKEEIFNNENYLVLNERKKNEYNNSIYFLKSFNRKFIVYVIKDNENIAEEINLFINFIAKINEKFSLFNEDKILIKKESLTDSIYKDNNISIKDLFNKENEIILTTSSFFNTFLMNLESISNYFYYRYLENNSSKSFLNRLGKMFSLSSKDEEIGTLYNDLIYSFNLTILNGDKMILFLNSNDKVGSYLKALNIYSSLISNNKLDLNIK